MEISDTKNFIRQHQPGQFRRPEDGKEPFAHVNDQKSNSTAEQKKCSVYIDDTNIVTLEKDRSAYFPKLFDFDTGIKYTIEHTSDTKKEEQIKPQYDKTGKKQIITKQEGFVDQLT